MKNKIEQKLTIETVRDNNGNVISETVKNNIMKSSLYYNNNNLLRLMTNNINIDYIYDEHGNCINEKHYNDKDGELVFEKWNQYDSNNNCIYEKFFKGFEIWTEYDKNGNIVHRKCSNGYEECHEGEFWHIKYPDGSEDYFDAEETKIISKYPNGVKIKFNKNQTPIQIFVNDVEVFFDENTIKYSEPDKSNS